MKTITQRPQALIRVAIPQSWKIAAGLLKKKKQAIIREHKQFRKEFNLGRKI